MSNQKIKILPLKKVNKSEPIIQYTSLEQILFYLEVLRGEVFVKELSDNSKKRLSKQIDVFKSFLLDLSEFDRENKKSITEVIEVNYINKLPGFIGDNDHIQNLIKDSAKWAQTPYPVLISGETGTGKEMFARLIHKISGRKKFLPINCGAIPSNLIESELFGHTKGAFTGAHQSRKGKFEETDDGTIFLDEIGELEEYIQVKLLRVIQFGEIQRVGSDKVIKVNTRVIAATNKNIKEQIENEKLREDLYFRLACFELKIPPLRERRDDIPDLFRHFLNKCSSELEIPIPRISKKFKDFLYKEYSFPGNIRELENIAKRISVLGNEDHERIKLINEYSSSDNPSLSEKINDRVKVLKKDLIINTLKQLHGSVQKSSVELGLSESRLYQLCRKFKIIPKDYQSSK